MSKSHVQLDWEQREYIEEVTTNIKKVTEFLNRFGMLMQILAWIRTNRYLKDTSTRYKLAKINEKLTRLERQMDYLESGKCTFSLIL